MIAFRVLCGSFRDPATRRVLDRGEIFTVEDEEQAARLERMYKQLIARMQEDVPDMYPYDTWTIEELRRELKARGQTVGGRTRRETMIRRLLAMDTERGGTDGSERSGRQADRLD